MKLGKLVARLGPPAALMVGQTNFMDTTVSLIQSVIPVMVLVLVLKMLFSSFKEIGKE